MTRELFRTSGKIPRPLVIGERINAQGSRAVKRMLLADDYDGVVAIARAQVEAGAHALDVCVTLDEVGDEPGRMVRLVTRLAKAFTVPLAIDSTDPVVIERALEQIPGRGIVNSINLAGRTRIDRMVPIARKHGAAIVALCIDEQGMARTRQRKLEVARRLYHAIVNEHHFPAEALLVDPLTFPIAKSETGSDAETIAAIRLIRRELPGARTIVGISDVSFGLAAEARDAVNVDFLRRAIAAGLDAAIVNPALFARAQTRIVSPGG